MMMESWAGEFGGRRRGGGVPRGRGEDQVDEDQDRGEEEEGKTSSQDDRTGEGAGSSGCAAPTHFSPVTSNMTTSPSVKTRLS
jgi:hypothetical protein